MKKVHLSLTMRAPTLCGAPYMLWQYVNTYIKCPDLRNGYYYPYYTKETNKWCPDCLKHPDVVMAALNGSNV